MPIMWQLFDTGRIMSNYNITLKTSPAYELKTLAGLFLLSARVARTTSL